jgi:hypothetical protein
MGSPSNALNISQAGLVYFDGAYSFDGRVPISSDSTITITINPTTIDFKAVDTGTITSVNGTPNRITVSAGANPVIDISATYVGQTSITTLGTITTGVWSGTNIALNKGGTNASLTASNGGMFYSTATAGAILSGTATAGQLLRSGASTAPTWTTSTFPATNAINTLLYASAANVMSALATANNGTLITSAGGIPSISSTLPSAVQGNITTVGTVSSGTFGGSEYSAANFVNGTNFTPSVGGSPTYSNQLGVYERIGNVVFIRLRVTFTSGPTGGNINIAGLPFAGPNNANLAAFSVWRSGGALATGGTMIMAVNKQGVASIDLYGYNSVTGTASALAQAATDDIIITGCYSLT